MFNKNNKLKLIFIFYILFVFSLTLLPYTKQITYSIQYNIIPFKSISNYLNHIKNFGIINWQYIKSDHMNLISILYYGVTVSFMNILGNILLFIPLGFILPIIKNKRMKIKYILILSLIISTFIEVTQFLFLTSRRADIDDIILNVLGGLLGFMLYKLIINYRK